MEKVLKEVKLSDIIFDESIYPRSEHNPSKVQEYAENIEIVERHGILFYYSKGLWIATLLNGRIEFPNHNTEFCNNVFHRFLENIEYNKINENEYRNSICNYLKLNGYIIEKEKYVERSRIDIYAIKGMEEIIIETKMKSNSNDICHALGQILFYKEFYPNATCYIATNSKTNSKLIQLLNKYNINIWSKQ